jgi:hypothetical protein
VTGEVPPDEAGARVETGSEAEVRDEAEVGSEAEVGGEAACWAHLVCPQCGAMESEGHQPGCPAAPALPGDPRR